MRPRSADSSPQALLLQQPNERTFGNAFAALAAILKTAKRTWHGRSEAKAHGSLPKKKPFLQFLPLMTDDH
jgi:hypothetical protein